MENIKLETLITYFNSGESDHCILSFESVNLMSQKRYQNNKADYWSMETDFRDSNCKHNLSGLWDIFKAKIH